MDVETLGVCLKKTKDIYETEVKPQVAQSVTNWLSEHVDPSTGYVIDDTLTISGAAADAKVTGDNIANLKNQIEAADNAIELLEEGSLSAVSANIGDVPFANGDGTWNWNNINYVTPQMFGAIGDGNTDDTQAFESAIEYIKTLIKSRASVGEYIPSQYMGGITFFIPEGVYNLTNTLYIPSLINVIGEGCGVSILKFNNTCNYGISLDGLPYNSIKTYSGSISKITIAMSGNGVGLSNVELSTSSTNANHVSASAFSDIQITNTKVGVIFQGLWNVSISNFEISVCSYGMIIDEGANGGGSNNIKLDKVVINNAKNCGLYCAGRGIIANNMDIEAIGDTWREDYSSETYTVNGVSYSTSSPCGVYITKSARATFESPWFEKIHQTEDETDTYAFLCENLATHTAGNPKSRLIINSPFFNNDVTNALKVDGAILLYVTNPYKDIGENFAVLNNLGSYSTCVFSGLDIYQARNVIASPTQNYNSIIFENVLCLGSNGRLNNYTSTASTTGNRLMMRKYEYADNNSYDCLYEEYINTSSRTLRKSVNSHDYLRAYYSYGKVGLPNNVGTVNVSSGDTTVSITYETEKTNYFVWFISEDATAAATLTAGYYVDSTAWNKINVTFLQAFSANATLHYFIMTT